MLEDHKIEEIPPAPSFKKLLGPSFILLGLGLGSGELIMWPYLTSNFGMGIIWAALLGVTMQFFMNMEIERYALVRGESVFVGLARVGKIFPVWFIFSTLIPWIWPGIITSSAVILGEVFGITNIKLFSVILLLLVGVILTLGPVLYKTQESIQKYIVLIGTPFILILSFFLAKTPDWIKLGEGLIGKGDGFWFLPAAIPFASFFGAVAYAGAGGNLNLAQSFYIKEKGFGMGKYAGRITSLLTGKTEKISLTGTKFVLDEIQMSRFRKWWHLINFEHGIVFWFIGSLTIISLAFLSYVTVFGNGNIGNISFIVKESLVIGQKTFPFLGRAFLVVAGFMLFSTQLGVMDTTSRILAENLTLTSLKVFPSVQIRRNFYLFLWLQIVLGIVVIVAGFTQPFALLTLSAVLNAVAMFVHVGLILFLNLRKLEKPIRPSFFRVAILVVTFIFFGYFSVRTFVSYF
jgi:hypothetical protein